MTEHVLMSDTEIVASGNCPGRWSAEEKLRIVEDTSKDGASISTVARRNGVPLNVFISECIKMRIQPKAH